MVRIKEVKGREIIDSRGNPTLEVEVYSSNGIAARASVPSGASTGTFEALELRDGDFSRYHGKGVKKAIKLVADIGKKLKGMDIHNYHTVDLLMKAFDSTIQKSKIGANTTLGISLAVCKLLAAKKRLRLFEYFDIRSGSLPVPLLNVINGGAHADNELDFQEFMIAPHGFPKFSLAIRAASEVFQSLKAVLKRKGYNTNVGDEGGFAPQLKTAKQAIEIIIKAIEKAGYKAGRHISVSLDVAANELYDEGYYVVNGKKLTSDRFIKSYEKIIVDYPVVSIEDPLAEEDWIGWTNFTREFGNKVIVIGDDLYVTNLERLKRGILLNASNGILIKPNQIGTLSETVECVRLAGKNRIFPVISHRSGETEDTTISHLAVGLGIPAIKTGSICRGERTAKYNELIRIEEYLGKRAKYQRLPGFVFRR